MGKRRFFTVLFLLAAVLFSVRLKKAPEKAPAPAVRLRVLHEGELLLMPLEEYLVGVVAADMPADFEWEALRAQAVAARTYALYCAGTGRHADADVCTDFRCCQAWRSDEDLRESWGGAYDEKLARVSGAVESTAGQYLRFAGKPAFTAFHSSSAGYTEACGAIWSELPYLKSVSSPEDAESVPNYVSRVSLPAEKLKAALLEICPEADFRGEAESWLGELQRDESGRVAAAVIGGVPFSGVKLRSLFSLRSTAFSLDYADGLFSFTVTGFGHGVGMSQYGAKVMAARGQDYAAILAHYYPGTELSVL